MSKVDIQTVLFPVEARPVFVLLNDTKTPNLFDAKSGTSPIKRAPNHLAIVDLEREHTLAVVSKNYRLVLNSEAIELGKECFREVFTDMTAKGMTPFNIIMPKTRSFCHIDYVHEEYCFEPWKNYKWVPYLRVTNSYNKTMPLRFDLGFCRWICMNGMISRHKSIKFKFFHTKNQMMKIEIATIPWELKQLEVQFIEQLKNMKRYYVPEEKMFPLLCRALNIQFKEQSLQNREWRQRALQFKEHVTTLTNRYFKELGSNGYAALNVITDFSSRPKLYISAEAMVDSLQKRIGDWTEDFLQAIEDSSFDFDEYLGSFVDIPKLLK